jgi:hypothetical protein
MSFSTLVFCEWIWDLLSILAEWGSDMYSAAVFIISAFQCLLKIKLTMSVDICKREMPNLGL